jgi:hypothetical protein
MQPCMDAETNEIHFDEQTVMAVAMLISNPNLAFLENCYNKV